MPSLSLMPHSVTIRRVWSVAILMSPAAPLETLSAPKELIFGADKVSNGAAGDIKMATDQTRRMVTEWGMSDKLGMIAYGDNSQEVFLGHSVTQNKNVSEATAREIDSEIKSIIDNSYKKARKHLN